MNNKQELIRAIGHDILYIGVFDKTREELLLEAKTLAGSQWDYMGWNDEDEAMRDWMTIDALQELNQAESMLTDALQKHDKPVMEIVTTTMMFYRKIFGYVIKIWE